MLEHNLVDFKTLLKEIDLLMNILAMLYYIFEPKMNIFRIPQLTETLIKLSGFEIVEERDLSITQNLIITKHLQKTKILSELLLTRCQIKNSVVFECVLPVVEQKPTRLYNDEVYFAIKAYRMGISTKLDFQNLDNTWVQIRRFLAKPILRNQVEFEAKNRVLLYCVLFAFRAVLNHSGESFADDTVMKSVLKVLIYDYKKQKNVGLDVVGMYVRALEEHGSKWTKIVIEENSFVEASEPDLLHQIFRILF
jgi:hypothetical protein